MQNSMRYVQSTQFFKTIYFHKLYTKSTLSVCTIKLLRFVDSGGQNSDCYSLECGQETFEKCNLRCFCVVGVLCNSTNEHETVTVTVS